MEDSEEEGVREGMKTMAAKKEREREEDKKEEELSHKRMFRVHKKL